MTRRLLVVFVDALGPAELERAGAAFAELPHRRSLRGVLGYSSGAIASLLTGAPPAAHVRMCLFTARPSGGSPLLAPLAWLGLLPRTVHERTRVRALAARTLARRAGLSGYVALHRVPPSAFGWLDLPEREDLFRARSIGELPTFLEQAREACLRVYASPWQLPERTRWKHAHASIKRLAPDLAFLYAATLGGALHRGGSRGEQGGQALDAIATHVHRAREEMARGGGDVSTLVVGDHGMADVHSFIDPRPVVRKLGARAFVDSTMLRVWGDDGQVARARRRLETAGWPGRFLGEDELRARGAPVDGAPYGRGLFLLEEGAIFAPSYVGGRVAGMHGYDVSARSAVAALASDRPIPDGVAAISDVAAVVRQRLDLPEG